MFLDDVGCGHEMFLIEDGAAWHKIRAHPTRLRAVFMSAVKDYSAIKYVVCVRSVRPFSLREKGRIGGEAKQALRLLIPSRDAVCLARIQDGCFLRAVRRRLSMIDATMMVATTPSDQAMGIL